ncbi:hypothetical protein STAS_34884 [Striga asiatica]|uniref:Uncharacterized protein n=1 Tax=Striga asiatica TaxID=4170 RepID=A0A5A7RIN8_STRAF|nr:hypothetical protein STAS_34884 [Striga asiatica]
MVVVKRRNIDTGTSSSRLLEFASPSIHVHVLGVADDIDEATIDRMFGSIHAHQQEQQQPYHDHFDDIFGESPLEVQQPTQQEQPNPNPASAFARGRPGSAMFKQHYMKEANPKRASISFDEWRETATIRSDGD